VVINLARLADGVLCCVLLLLLCWPQDDGPPAPAPPKKDPPKKKGLMGLMQVRHKPNIGSPDLPEPAQCSLALLYDASCNEDLATASTGDPWLGCSYKKIQ
jgi:hypothetical protein